MTSGPLWIIELLRKIYPTVWTRGFCLHGSGVFFFLFRVDCNGASITVQPGTLHLQQSPQEQS